MHVSGFIPVATYHILLGLASFLSFIPVATSPTTVSGFIPVTVSGLIPVAILMYYCVWLHSCHSYYLIPVATSHTTVSGFIPVATSCTILWLHSCSYLMYYTVASFL